MFGPVFRAACMCIVLGSPATASERWMAIDLGSTRTEGLCVEAGTLAMLDYANVFGADSIRHSAWTVVADGLSGGPHDALVTCTHAAAKTARATLVLHSADEAAARMISRRIATSFGEHYRRLESKWLQEAFDRFGM